MSTQLRALDERLTAGEQRRRTLKIARRRARGIGHDVVAFKRVPRPSLLQRIRQPWFGYKALRNLRKAAQDAAGEWLSRIIARRDALAEKRTPRCPYHHVIDATKVEPERIVTCAGRMRPLPLRKGAATPDWRCSRCGRSWARVKTGWERVA